MRERKTGVGEWEEAGGTPELTRLVVTKIGGKRSIKLTRKGETRLLREESYRVQVTM